MLEIKIKNHIKGVPWTQTPNSVLDYWLPRLKDTELRVLLVLVRMTHGWHRPGSAAKISYAGLKLRTGRESEAIAHALKSLASRELIHIDRKVEVRKANVEVRQSEVVKKKENDINSGKP